MTRKRNANFTVEELKKIFNVDMEHHVKVFMPNEILEDLREVLTDEKGNPIKECKSSTHVAFAYAYTYLAHYMYRYCKYYYMENYETESEIDEKMIKQVLGFPAKADAYTYLTKKEGILDKLGYIRKVSDKPYKYELEEVSGKDGKVTFEPFFEMESDYPEIYGNNKNRKINFPVRGFWREDWAEEDDYYNGTFYEKDNTHQINFNVFMYCMADPELGVEGFYLYSMLVYANNKFPNGFDCSNERFVSISGLSLKEVKVQLKNLEMRKMIGNDHKPFCIDKPYDKKTKANTYWIKGIEEFARNEHEYIILPKQRKISAKQYEREIGWAGEDYKDKNLSGDIFDGENPFSKMSA
jgi:hypothetical protein